MTFAAELEKHVARKTTFPPMNNTTTPGPWHVVRFGSGRISIGQSGGAQTTVCDLNPAAYDNGDELEPNARLIAAAPDLLAVARLTLRNVDSFLAHVRLDTDPVEVQSLKTWANAARAAILKAEGGK